MQRYKRSTRVSDLLRREVADIIQNRLKDPRVGFVAVTDVRMSDDLKNATVYLSVLEKTRADETVEILNRSSGFIKTELGQRIRLRYMPKLLFRIDEVVERGDRIDRLLKTLKDET